MVQSQASENYLKTTSTVQHLLIAYNK